MTIRPGADVADEQHRRRFLTLVRSSFFALHGAPLAEGVDWPGLTVLAASAATGFGAEAFALARRDIRR